MQLLLKHIDFYKYNCSLLASMRRKTWLPFSYEKGTLNDVIFILADFSRIGPVFLVLADLFCIGRVFFIRMMRADLFVQISILM